MSVRMMSKVWESSKHGGTELLMLLAISDFADDAGRAYPSVPTLAAKCRVLPRQAIRVISALRKSGELSVKFNEGPRGTNLYQIVVSANTEPLSSVPPLAQMTPLSSKTPTPVIQGTKPLAQMTDEPSMNHQEPSKKKSAAQTFALPDWIPVDAWTGFVEMRTKIRAPMTNRAMDLKVKELDRLRKQGHDIGAVLDKSTSNNWKDVYAPKTETGAGSDRQPWEGAR